MAEHPGKDGLHFDRPTDVAVLPPSAAAVVRVRDDMSVVVRVRDDMSVGECDECGGIGSDVMQ